MSSCGRAGAASIARAACRRTGWRGRSGRGSGCIAAPGVLTQFESGRGPFSVRAHARHERASRAATPTEIGRAPPASHDRNEGRILSGEEEWGIAFQDAPLGACPGRRAADRSSSRPRRRAESRCFSSASAHFLRGALFLLVGAALVAAFFAAGFFAAGFFAGAFLAAGLRVAVLAKVVLLSMPDRESIRTKHCNSDCRLISR